MSDFFTITCTVRTCSTSYVFSSRVFFSRMLSREEENASLKSLASKLEAEVVEEREISESLRGDLKIECELRAASEREGRRRGEEAEAGEAARAEGAAARAKEQEEALEELGARLSESRLEVEALREERRRAVLVREASWQDDKQVDNCQACSREFGMSRRKVRQKNQDSVSIFACCVFSTTAESAAASFATRAVTTRSPSRPSPGRRGSATAAWKGTCSVQTTLGGRELKSHNYISFLDVFFSPALSRCQLSQ